MSYAFHSPRAQVSSSLPRTNDDYSHDPYSADPQHQYAAYYSQPDHDQYRDDVGDSHDSNPARTLHRGHQESYDDDRHYSDTRAGASAIDDHNMSAEKDNYGSPYAAKRASGNSIWTKDDKRAFSSRSCPAKFFRILIGNLILAIIIVVSIILLIVMFLRPPNVGISGVSVPSQNAVNYENGAFSFNVSVDISVSNPNSISASIKKLNATAYDSADQSTALGRGLVTNQAIRPNANTTVQFPFQIRYSQSEDPDFSILKDIASDCGLTGGSGGGDLSFLFKIEVDVEVLSITVPVNINRNISFPCPLSASSLQGILGGLGSALGNILGNGGGAGRRAISEGAEADDGEAAALVRRQLAKMDVIDMSPVELVAAVADGLVRRYAPTPKDEGKRSLADEHDAL